MMMPPSKSPEGGRRLTGQPEAIDVLASLSPAPRLLAARPGSAHAPMELVCWCSGDGHETTG